MPLEFGLTHREAFRTLVRAQTIDDAAAVRDAERIASAIAAKLPGAPGLDLRSILLHKIAGYNADVHTWVIRARRAFAATERVLASADSLFFEPTDLQLGEYFLLEYARARGAEVRTAVPWPILVASLCVKLTPRCRTPGFEPVEAGIVGGTPAPRASRTRHDPRPMDALFVASMKSYLNPMIPVMRELVRRGRRGVLLAPADSAWTEGVPEGIEAISFESLGDADVERAHRAAAAAANISWAARVPRLSDAAMLDGVSLWPLIREDVEHVARVYVPHVAACDEAVRALISRTGASTLVVARLRRATELAAAHAARAMGSRVVMVPHGHIGARATRRFIDGDFALPDLVGVWGPFQRDLAMARGAKPGAIVEIGNPAWDELAVKPPDRFASRRKLAESLGLSVAHCWFLLAGQDESRTQLSEVAGALLAAPLTAVLARPHPAESLEGYRALEAAFPGRVRIVAETALPELSAACDACVTFHSTVNIESLLCGTPVITAAFGELRRADRLLNLEDFGLPIAMDGPALSSLAREIACDSEGFRRSQRLPMRRVLSAALTNHADGGAARRLVELMVPARAVAA